MKSEILIMYPEIIIYAIIATGVVLLFWRKKKKFKKGVVIANTKYVKRTKYFKFLNAKYRIYNALIKITCIILILIAAVLSARVYEVKTHEEKYNNRDVMLCMDFSPSMAMLNYDVLKTMTKTVKKFNDERFGFTIFDSSANTLAPLNTDYRYIVSVLDNISDDFYGSALDEEAFLNKEATYGIHLVDGFSRVPDGIVSCAVNFTEHDDRTKILILSTDNLGKGLFFTMDKAIEYCKTFGIKVYPIGAISLEVNTETNKTARDELIKLANETGGKYFDFSTYTMDKVSEEIEKLNKSSIIVESYVTKNDLPEDFVQYILILIPILFILDWRVRI